MKIVFRAFAGWILPIVLSACAVSVLLFNDGIGRLEGHFYPVVSVVDSVTLLPAPGGFEMSASAEKLRACDWRKTIFSLGARNGGNIILTDHPHRDPAVVNGPGRLHWGHIYVPIKPERANEIFADAYHQCGWRPWLTISRFYN